jgi:hypothetical protein
MDAQFDLLMANKKGILARVVTEAVEKNASGLLQKLRAKNPLVESVKDPATGTVTTRSMNQMYDGTEMMVDFLNWLDRDVRDDEADFHLEVLTELSAIRCQATAPRRNSRRGSIESEVGTAETKVDLE